MDIKKKISFISAGFLILLNFFAWQQVFVLVQPKYLEVSFLSVGQGDSQFAKTPENHQILIDGGPGSLVLKELSSLIPFWDRTIDLIILTHPEKDHMYGLIEVLKRYKADYVLWTGIVRESSEYTEWTNVLKQQKQNGAKIIAVKAGDIVKLGNIRIEIVYPFENLEGQDVKSANETSVVNKIIYSKNSFLFTGDISSKTEKEIIAMSNVAMSADVLKVAHHGSKYSTSDLFLENVEPKFAVIGVGKNSYGHPTNEVLQRLQNFDIKIFRTDENGTIKFLSDGENLIIKKTK